MSSIAYEPQPSDAVQPQQGARQEWQPHSDVRTRLRFERGAYAAHPGMRCTATGRSQASTITYRLVLDLPAFPSRGVKICLLNMPRPTVASITVDGPTPSPHRFADGSLCVWRADDPREQRWTSEDGLLALITHVRHHLFKEAHWRATRTADGKGEWLGPEAPHTPLEGGNRHQRRAA
jgi:hypothetical protein